MGIWGFGGRAADTAGKVDGVISLGGHVLAAISIAWAVLTAMFTWISGWIDIIASHGWAAVTMVSIFAALLSILFLLWAALIATRVVDWIDRSRKSSKDAPVAATPALPEPWGVISLASPTLITLNSTGYTRITIAQIKVISSIQIVRVTLLFKGLRHSGTFDLVDPQQSISITSGEIRSFKILHKNSAGVVFLGDPDTATPEPNALDQLAGSHPPPAQKNLLSTDEVYSFRIVACADGHADIHHDFTLYTFRGSSPPFVVDPSWRRPFDDADRAGERRQTKRSL